MQGEVIDSGIAMDVSNINVNTIDEDNNTDNLWTSLLASVRTDRRTQLPSAKNLLILGDRECGKTTLVAKMQGLEDPKKGQGLEYTYIDVRDEYNDGIRYFMSITISSKNVPKIEAEKKHTRLGVWMLDGDTRHSNLLQFALTQSNLAEVTAIICVSMEQPWAIMEQLQAWASILQDHVDNLPVGVDTIKRLQTQNIRRWQSYVEPGDEAEGNLTHKRIIPNKEENEDVSKIELQPLPENTLTRNLGFDLFVVVTKTDTMTELERDYDYKEEHFDFIQQAIRKFCLQYGAALVYTSVKEEKNCDLMYKCLVHKIYGFPFRTPALVVEKDAVFIPAGWDNERKISILQENMHSIKPDQYYTDVIAKPLIRKVGAPSRELEVIAEDEQSFLLRHQQLLLQEPVPPASSFPSMAKLPDATRKSASSTNTQGGSPKKMEPGKGAVGSGAAGTSEGVLANFFNSLLSKKTGQGIPGQPMSKTSTPSDDLQAAAVRSDVAAELDRMTRTQQQQQQSKKVNIGNTNHNTNGDQGSSDC